jgi:NAD(P)-dependent dehydrogenase (short-subunit alcohol dehydrogenase family)
MTEDSIGTAKALADSALLVCGGTAGVGLATAHAFAAAGTRRIAILGRNPERGAAALAAVKERAPHAKVIFVAADSGDLEQATRALAEVHRELDGLDIVINSTTASYVPKLLFRMDPAEMAPTLLAQAMPPIVMSRLALPYLRAQKSGVILNIASDAAKVPTPGETVLGAAMAAIVTFSRTLAMEAKRDGIRVNVLTPSLIANTDLYTKVMADPFSEKLFTQATKLANLGVAQPEDLAGLLVYLASPAAARLTGQAISLNGGISAA